MTAPSPVFVSSEAAATAFDWASAIAALQDAYAQPPEPAATPPRAIASSGKSWLRTLPAAPPGGRYYGAKLMGMSQEAEDPAVQYVIVLFDRTTSRIAAFVDADKVTGYRTAATSAAALDRLAAPQPGKLGVLGSGLEAAMHIRAFCAARRFERVEVFSPTEARREALAGQLREELGVEVVAADSARQAIEGADVALAAARSHGEKPILFAEWLKPGAVTMSIGSTVPSQREIDVSVVAQSDLIVCDMVHEVMSETGDMIAAAQAGIDFASRCHPLSALMRGELAALLPGARHPMFKSVGGGMQDVVVAGLVLDRVLEMGLAVDLPMSFSAKRV